ncbi:TPA: molecular chaperone [Enterobacter ludwigii]|nr:molecular chaperone [Enterobacter ludwigii]HDR2600003.1 molecular chaperone [Enterobacter ludwigii]
MALTNDAGRSWLTVSALAGSAAALLVSLSAQAGGIGLGAIRLVYDQKAGQVSVPVRNTSSSPYVISTRVTQTQDARRQEQTPFVVTPPLFRLEGGAQGNVRIMGNPQSLPADRESVFYVTVAGIPASNPLSRDGSEGFVNGAVKFAYGSTIKLFYRPAGLPSSSSDAVRGVRFTRTAGGVKVDNPSPYYVTFRDISLNGQAVKFGKNQPDMLAPLGSMTVPAGRVYPISQAGKVSWSAIVDIGVVVSASGTLQ